MANNSKENKSRSNESKEKLPENRLTQSRLSEKSQAEFLPEIDAYLREACQEEVIPEVIFRISGLPEWRRTIVTAVKLAVFMVCSPVFNDDQNQRLALSLAAHDNTETPGLDQMAYLIPLTKKDPKQDIMIICRDKHTKPSEFALAYNEFVGLVSSNLFDRNEKSVELAYYDQLSNE